MKKSILTAFIMVAFLSTAFAGDAPAPSGSKDINPVVRVCIMDGVPSMRLELKGGFTIAAIDTGKDMMSGSSFDSNVAATADGIMLGDKEFRTPGIAVKVRNDSTIYVDGKRFRGDIDIIRKENSKLMVINHIPVEEYLYGVLHHEVSDRWPIAALKAQAIAARTFALYQARQSKLQPYDLRSDVYSQVYGGSASEKWATTKAVNLTRSKVLTYNGALFPTYYHATCAGSTEDASSLWNINLPPLKGVKCNYCAASPHYKWTKELPLKDIESALRKSGYKIGGIRSVTILSRNRSGRADKLEIKDNAGVSVILTAKDFRQLVGPNEIRSTKFDLSVRNDKLVVTGRGWGHGVGMCQWGAYGLSKKGRTAEEILRFYYPGTKVMPLDKLKDRS